MANWCEYHNRLMSNQIDIEKEKGMDKWWAKWVSCQYMYNETITITIIYGEPSEFLVTSSLIQKSKLSTNLFILAIDELMANIQDNISWLMPSDDGMC